MDKQRNCSQLSMIYTDQELPREGNYLEKIAKTETDF